MNKGPDRTKVYLVPLNFVVSTAKKNFCDVVMAFYNHPAHDPQHYSYRRPSSIDLQSAAKYSQDLNSHDISYVDHVCERGRAYRYCLSPVDGLYPFSMIQQSIRTENEGGRKAHVGLHFQLYF